MNKLLFGLLLICLGHVSYSQLSYPYQDIKLEKPSDYKETESLALSAANFLLSTPFAEGNTNRNNALDFLTKWLEGSKGHEVYMKGMVMELATDRNTLGLFIAATAKYRLENKAEAVNPIKTEQEAAKILLAYCDDPKNNFKLKKKYRKVLEKN